MNGEDYNAPNKAKLQKKNSTVKQADSPDEKEGSRLQIERKTVPDRHTHTLTLHISHLSGKFLFL